MSSARAPPPHFVEQTDSNDNATHNTHNGGSHAAAAAEDESASGAATSFLARFLASFTACFGTALAPVAPIAVRASDLAEPYFVWMKNRLGEYVRVLRGSALSEPLIDDGGNDNDRRAAPASAASTAATAATTSNANNNAFLGSSGGSASPLTQSEIQGSVFFPPVFPPTIVQDSVMLKSFNEYRPPNIKVEASTDVRLQNRNAPSPSLLR